MFYRILADLVVVGHFAFVLFVIFGGFFVLWSKRVAWIHVPCVLWAILIELAGWICPLTPLEIMLRRKGGTLAYKSGFIEHYILPVLYPTVLTRRLQITIGFLVFAINLGIYGWVLYRTWRHKSGDIFC
jgi:hypothetical protein